MQSLDLRIKFLPDNSMKKLQISLFCILLTASTLCSQKDYERPKLRYNAMKEKSESPCADGMEAKIEQAIEMIETNQSSSAIVLVEETRKAMGQCAFSEMAYAEALFRNGQWLRSNQVIDAAIKEYGPVLFLVRARAGYCLEMAEYGVGMKAVDGNMVYLPEDKHLPFNEKQFKEANLSIGCEALEFLESKVELDEKSALLYLMGQVYKQMGNFEKSNQVFSNLRQDPEYQNRATSFLIQNLIAQKDFVNAEKELLGMCERIPRNYKLYQNLEKLYMQMGETDKAKECQQKSFFFYCLPAFTTLPYSEENLAALRYFGDAHSIEEKDAALAEIEKRPLDEAIDFYIGIINMHENHGNGLESSATRLLGEAGNPAVEKLIGLLRGASSTCGMSNAGLALAKIKDERGWDAIVEMLPLIDRVGMTTTLPLFPQCLVNFDQERAITVLLSWIKERLERKAQEKGEDPFDGLGEIFADGVIYRPLNVVAREHLTEKAKEMGFDEAQIKKLLDEVYYELPVEEKEDEGK